MDLDNERSAAVTIGGKEYSMVLTTKATRLIASRYGGLDKLGDKLMKSEDAGQSLEEVVWIVTLLCNQGVQIHNLRCPDECQPELTADEVELLTTPLELASLKDAIMEAMQKGTKRNVESEPDAKNTTAG